MLRRQDVDVVIVTLIITTSLLHHLVHRTQCICICCAEQGQDEADETVAALAAVGARGGSVSFGTVPITPIEVRSKPNRMGSKEQGGAHARELSERAIQHAWRGILK